MRPPRVVFPVSDCITCVGLPCKGVASGSGVLLGAEDAKVGVPVRMMEVLLML